MSRRASTFDRLALKEQVLINRQMRGLGELNNEFQKIDQMRQKLDEMAREQVPNDGEQIAGTFRVTAPAKPSNPRAVGYGQQSLRPFGCRIEEYAKKIALSGRRREKSASKADELRANERNEREMRREDEEASRRRTTRV